VAVAVLLLLFLIWVWVRSRRRRRADDQAQHGELTAGEHRDQFLAAAESLPFASDPAEIARDIAGLFRDHLSIRVLALFAGAESSNQLENIMLRALHGEERAPELEALLPRTISADVLDAYKRPQLVPAGQFASGPQGLRPGSPLSTGALTKRAEEGQGEISEEDIDLANTMSAQSRDSTASSMHRSDSIVVLPWTGPFNWRGLIVGGPQGQVELYDLSAVYEFQGPLSSRLAVALQLERDASGLDSVNEQSSRVVEFVRALPAMLPLESNLPEVLGTIAKMLAADSVAFWTVDRQTGTLEMSAAHKLNVADFLPVPIGQAFSGRVVESALPLIVEDALSDARCLFPNQYRDSGIASYLGVPVFSGNEVMGVLEVHTATPRAWGESNAAALQVAAASIETRPSGTSTGPPSADLRAEGAYIALSEALQGLGSRKELLEASVEVIGHAVGASRTLILQPELAAGGSTPGYSVRSEYCDQGVGAALGRTFPEGPLRRVIESSQSGAAVAIDDSSSESLMPPMLRAELGVLCEIAAPIKTVQARPWLLWVQRCDHQRPWARDEIEFVERVARQISMALNNISAIEKAQREVQSAHSEQQKAAEAASRARGFIDALPEAVIGLDREGRITFFNAFGRNTLRLKNDDLGRMAEMTEALNMSEESLWDQVNSCEVVTRFECGLISPPKAEGDSSGANNPSDGPVAEAARPVSISVSPIRSERQEVTGRIVVISDVAHVTNAAAAQASDASARADSAAAAAAAQAEAYLANEAELQHRIDELENSLAEAHRVIEKVAATDGAAVAAGAAVEEMERLRRDLTRASRAGQQLLEINRLKSDFIVNTGSQLDASLQSLLGFVELLGEGSYGDLTPQQLDAVRGIYAWARRMKGDVEWLIEYGSTRSQRLEESIQLVEAASAATEEGNSQRPAVGNQTPEESALYSPEQGHH
jgi:GAF domain-containing protein